MLSSALSSAQQRLQAAKDQVNLDSVALVTHFKEHGCENPVLNIKIGILSVRRTALAPLSSPRGRQVVVQHAKLMAQAVAIEGYIRLAEEDIVRCLENLESGISFPEDEGLVMGHEVEAALRLRILKLRASLEEWGKVSREFD